MQKGLLLVVSGPSGCGKGTVLKEVMQQQDLYYSVSLTTRAPRPGEVDGVQYHFVSKEQFEKMIARDEVLEHAEFCGNYYGTPRDAVEAMRNEGKNVILEIEVQGAQQVMQKCSGCGFDFHCTAKHDRIGKTAAWSGLQRSQKKSFRNGLQLQAVN